MFWLDLSWRDGSVGRGTCLQIRQPELMSGTHISEGDNWLLHLSSDWCKHAKAHTSVYNSKILEIAHVKHVALEGKLYNFEDPNITGITSRVLGVEEFNIWCVLEGWLYQKLNWRWLHFRDAAFEKVIPVSWLILRFSLNKHLLNISSALAIQVPRVSVDESEFTGGDDKVKECVLRTRTILNVISSTTKNKSTYKMINATSEPAVLWRCLGSAKDREEGISQAPALMSPHCSNSVPGKNLHWMEKTCASPVCVGRSLCSSLKCG